MIGYITELNWSGRHLMVGVLPIVRTKAKTVSLDDRNGIAAERAIMYSKFRAKDDATTFYSTSDGCRVMVVLQEYTDPERMQKILQELSGGRDLVDVSDDVLEGEVRRFFEYSGDS